MEAANQIISKDMEIKVLQDDQEGAKEHVQMCNEEKIEFERVMYAFREKCGVNVCPGVNARKMVGLMTSFMSNNFTM